MLKSTIYNEKQVKSTILTKILKNWSTNPHIFVMSYPQSTTFLAQKHYLQPTTLSDLQSTILPDPPPPPN